MGSVAGGGLERGTLEVAGVRRGYWLARGGNRHGIVNYSNFSGAGRIR
jgi:hypothetical protein